MSMHTLTADLLLANEPDHEGEAVTRDNCETAKRFVMIDQYGKRRVWRRNGQTHVWKSRPHDFRIPVKFGLYDYWYVTHLNAHMFTVE
jgi:hypothetical protein